MCIPLRRVHVQINCVHAYLNLIIILDNVLSFKQKFAALNFEMTESLYYFGVFVCFGDLDTPSI